MCDVDEEAVVAAVDAPSIYDIPKVLHSEGLDAYVVRRLGLPFRDVDWTDWDDLLRRVHRPAARGARRAGRQVRRPARRLPVGDRGAAGRRLRQRRQGGRPLGHLRRLRDAGGRRDAARRRRRHLRPRRVRRPRASRASSAPSATPASSGIPTLGLCLGLQCMVIEYARHVAGLEGAGLRRSSTSDAAPGHRDDGRPARRRRRRARPGRHHAAGLYPAALREGSVVARPTARRTSSERHRHRYEVNNAYREQLEQAGLVFSGTSPDGRLVEFVELPRDVHPYFVGTQAHPEFRSRPTRAHPLFAGLVAAGPGPRRRAAHAGTVGPDRRAATGSDVTRGPRGAGRSPTSRPTARRCGPSSHGAPRHGLGRPQRRGRPRRRQTVTREVSTTPARSVSSRWTRRTGCCWSGSTATRCGPTCGSRRPGCST